MAIKYGVIGTGALGGFYGGMLARAGQEVHFLFRSDFEHVRKNGLQVDSVNGDFQLTEVNAYLNSQDMPKCDVILVCMKTTGNHLLPALIKPLLHPKSVIVLLQNGLGLEEDLASQLTGANIAGGLAFICSSKVGPGHIHHLDFGKLIIGSHNFDDQEILNQVVLDFQSAGIQTDLAADLRYARWQKLVWNIPFNGMTVILNSTTNQLMANEYSRQLVLEMMLEVIHGANHCGVPLQESLAQQMIDMTIKMKPYAPSMKLDYDFMRPMEIAYIYSKPVQAAMETGFVMNKVSMLEKQLQFIEAHRLDK
ncbi:MAG TPA: putative 2-dehydropantoate 2-reductase [Prolixibacteraceae bacterium]|nr:putative 2-dehydropantoate 2-reductase [Prolixibacteraceae bacterium]